MTRYTRQDVLRILHLGTRQLAAWERAGLIAILSHPSAEDARVYTFEHLAQLRALREMRSRRLSPRSIRASIDAMQRVAGVRNVLTETSAVRRGSRLTFRHAGSLVDPVTHQLAFDFDPIWGELKIVNGKPRAAAATTPAATELQALFLRGVQLEESSTSLPEAITAYESLLALKPDHAPACINLGTIFYNRRDFAGAERMYRRATLADPDYALAFFDLGNVLDEMQRLPEAIAAYNRAIALVPTYADAHYNLALAFERQSERRRALAHWMTYVRLDPVGPWAAHARAQARKILSLERLSIVSRSGRRAATPRPATPRFATA